MSENSPSPLENTFSRLRADHREIEALFHLYFQEASPLAQAQLLSRLCRTLALHCALEAGVFIPAIAAASGNNELLEKTGSAYARVTLLINELTASDYSPKRQPSLILELHQHVNAHIDAAEAEDGLLAQARFLTINWTKIDMDLAKRREELGASRGFNRTTSRHKRWDKN